jgi:acyl carrier protein
MHNPSDTQDKQDTALRIAELYERVLGVQGVGGDDDFFVLGGTSLSAIRLLDLITEEHGVEVPVKNFYRATAVADLAREVDLLRAEGGE